jgi:hypothetical protein
LDDLFEVTLANPCSAATLAWDATTTTQELTLQTVGETVASLGFSSSVVNSALAHCQIEYTLQVANANGAYEWYSANHQDHKFIEGWQESGKLTIGGDNIKDNFADYSNFSKTVKVIAKAKYSTQPTGQIEQIFVVNIKDACATVGVNTPMTGFSATVISYDRKQKVNIPFNPVVLNQNCPVSYYIVDAATNAPTAETTAFTLSMSIAENGRITGTVDLADGQSRDWKVVAAIGTKVT